ncbi:hypothetical protein AUC71_10375 [Methyloceanibacter marginalis]|uniref:DisA/LigA helix-hairpin-helix motif domain-containing protein n=1 Tax=Methyloceanibacter marginalis TaxID=1774971 RepID=A0A1E3WBY6_9HYPH|nr:hypothetical protein AUC71_10375 [Methyloceanibacter marginalis]
MRAAGKDRDGETFAELDNIEGIGPTVAAAIADFFAEPHNVEVVEELLEQVSPQPLEAVDQTSPVSGKTVVFTGTLEQMTRSEAKRAPSASAPRSRVRSPRTPTMWWRVRERARSSKTPRTWESRCCRKTNGSS